MANKKSVSYQALNHELNDIVEKLQSEEVDIDQAVKLYEQGMELIEAMQARLKQAQNKVSRIKGRFDTRTEE